MEENPENILEELEETMQPSDGEEIWINTGHTQTAIEMAHKYAEKHGKEEVKLPDEFKRHTALFSDEDAKKLPPSRPYNHKIELTTEAPAKFNMKMYPMSAKDQEAENKFLDENIEKGYIVPSDSPYGFATFQVPKKDSDEKHYIIDYRPLNSVATTRLLQISILLSRMLISH